MYTRCPHCQTLFRVHPQQLSAARGRARCSHCGQVFDAIENLQSEADERPRPAAAPPETAADEPPTPEPPVAVGPPEEPGIPPEDDDLDQELSAFRIDPAEPVQTPALEVPDPSALDAELRRMSEFYEQTVAQSKEWSSPLAPPPPPPRPDQVTLTIADQTPPEPASEPAFPKGTPPSPPPTAADTTADEPPPARKRRRGGLLWFLGVLLLLLVAAAQLAWFQRERLVTDPRIRPLLEQICDRIGCTLPVVTAPERFKVLRRSVVSHPDQPGGLLIRLTFVNQAPFPQPYPLLQMTLFDRNETPLAQRRFTPQQYLESPVGDHSLLRPGQQVEVRMGLLDPGPKATGFKFDFLAPPGAGTDD